MVRHTDSQFDEITRVDPPETGPEFIVVANRLPVDRDPDGESVDGEPVWRTSPGGLVTAVMPVMRTRDGAWIGWAGSPDEVFQPFDTDSMHLVPVRLSAEELQSYYEGFSNATLWPLFHDVIVPPEYHRTWWDSYHRVNRRFAMRAALEAGPGATVWVQDYQLFLVPDMLRTMRSDLKIGFFLHIPFPPWEIFSQLPWRSAILRGMLGADLIGFQRPADAANFRRATRVKLGMSTKAENIQLHDRTVVARAFPISVDTEQLNLQARDPAIVARAKEIRRELGDPKVVMLGVDRMDYTKGIRHRLKALEELWHDKRISNEDVTFVQIATPSRERLDQYQQIRSDVELAVGRINGEYATLNNTVVHYFHRSYPREEMAAYYLAADVMLVTALRDGMNLVAKEYVACRTNDDGVLVLSEFAGAADQLRQAVQVNPHDIADLKDKIASATTMPIREQRKRMRPMRAKLQNENVQAWSAAFLRALDDISRHNAERNSATGDRDPVAPDQTTDAVPAGQAADSAEPPPATESTQEAR